MPIYAIWESRFPAQHAAEGRTVTEAAVNSLVAEPRRRIITSRAERRTGGEP